VPEKYNSLISLGRSVIFGTVVLPLLITT